MGKEIVLCDTDVLIELMLFNAAVVEQCIELGINNLFISAITKAELQAGCSNKTELNKLNKYLERFMVTEIDFHTSQMFSNIFQTYTLSHKPSIPDALNAAIALYYDVTLFTLNQKDYRYFKNIKLVKHSIKPIRIGKRT